MGARNQRTSGSERSQTLIKQMRFTIIDESDTVSFTGPGHIMKALAAAASLGARDARHLIQRAEHFDDAFSHRVLSELSVFDELVVREDLASIDQWLDQGLPTRAGAFRVFNQRMRNLSLLSDSLGVVLFNLAEQRIVQIENAYGPLQRSDRSRVRIDGVAKSRTYGYSLADSWDILP